MIFKIQGEDVYMKFILPPGVVLYLVQMAIS